MGFVRTVYKCTVFLTRLLLRHFILLQQCYCIVNHYLFMQASQEELNYKKKNIYNDSLSFTICIVFSK